MAGGKRHALLVGVGRYDHLRLAALPAAGRDVEELGALLREHGGFDVVSSVDEDHGAIWERICDLLEGRAPDDTLLLYYSGHGLPDIRRNFYLAARTTDPGKLQRNGISSVQVHDALRACEALRKVVVLDCCHSGAFDRPDDWATSKDGGEAPRAEPGDFDGGEGEGTFVLMATEARQKAPGDAAADGTSPFTSLLLRGLRGEAAPGGDKITARQIADFAAAEAPAALGIKPRSSAHQARGPIVLVDNPAGPAALLPRELRNGLASGPGFSRIGAAWELSRIARDDANPARAAAARRLLEGRLGPEGEPDAHVRQALGDALHSSFGILDWKPDDAILPDLNDTPDRYNLTGVWDCDDGGTYFVRNLGMEVLWFGWGLEQDRQPPFANVAYGRLQRTDSAPVLRLRWFDVPVGVTNLWGDLLLELEHSPDSGRVTGMVARERSGAFGGSRWAWLRHWGVAEPPEAEPEGGGEAAIASPQERAPEAP